MTKATKTLPQVNVLISFDKGSNKFKCTIDGNKFTTSKKDYIEFMFKKITGEKATFAEIESLQKPQVSDKFGINERFGFVEKLVNMVSSGVQPSAIITGQGGLGKTYTVMKTLQSAGIMDYNEVVAKTPVGGRILMSKVYVTIKGYSTLRVYIVHCSRTTTLRLSSMTATRSSKIPLLSTCSRVLWIPMVSVSSAGMQSPLARMMICHAASNSRAK